MTLDGTYPNPEVSILACRVVLSFLRSRGLLDHVEGVVLANACKVRSPELLVKLLTTQHSCKANMHSFLSPSVCRSTSLMELVLRQVLQRQSKAKASGG